MGDIASAAIEHLQWLSALNYHSRQSLARSDELTPVPPKLAFGEPHRVIDQFVQIDLAAVPIGSGLGSDRQERRIVVDEDRNGFKPDCFFCSRQTSL
jgi:hypothetical protein